MTADPIRSTNPTISQLKMAVLKPIDAWWVVFVADPLALRLIWVLLRVLPRVTPNQITGASLAAGVFAALAFANGWYLIGALAYQVSFILDCVDGKLARWHGLSSRRGQYWDGLVNTLVYGASVGGLAWSQVGDQRVVMAALVLLITWTLQMHTAPYLGASAEGGHVLLAVRPGGWLARHRLLPPLTFFDKHALLFFLAPLAHVVLEVMAALAVLEGATWVLKARIAWRDTGSRAEDV